jgi:hypothetical protein
VCWLLLAICFAAGRRWAIYPLFPLFLKEEPTLLHLPALNPQKAGRFQCRFASALLHRTCISYTDCSGFDCHPHAR